MCHGIDQRIGLLGGSFNPAHEGHLAISLEAKRRLQLHQVWWLVSPQNPLKPVSGMAPIADRLDSARAMTTGHRSLVVKDLENAYGTQYTVDTVRRLQRSRTSRFVWLIGADNLVQLPMWRSWQTLLNMVPIAVFDREPYSYSALAGRVARAFAAHRIQAREAARLVGSDPPAWVYFRLRRRPESSTAIRQAARWSAANGQVEGTSS